MAETAPARLPGTWSRKGKLSELLAQHFVREIAEGRLRPGDRLAPEAAMVREFGVGRATVREALRLLETYGLVVIRTGPPGGSVITEPDAVALARTITVHLQVNGVTFRQLLEARVIMEPILARLAAQHVTPETAQRIERILERTRTAEPFSAEMLESNFAFHAAMSSCSGNGVLDLFGHALNDIYVTRRVSVNDEDPAGWTRTCKEHEAIGHAVIAGRPALAERHMRAHIEHFAERFAQLHSWVLETVIDLDVQSLGRFPGA